MSGGWVERREEKVEGVGPPGENMPDVTSSLDSILSAVRLGSLLHLSFVPDFHTSVA